MSVSVVIPSMHRHRLPLLSATLRSLRRCHAIGEVIIAEMGRTPCANAVARDHDAIHVFTHRDGPFDRSLVLNTGSALARGREILWMDGDFLFAPDFVARAQREMRASGADYFYPHSMMHYLGEQDTQAILAGGRAPTDCRSIRAMAPLTGNPGGMGMVSADFLRSHGGMMEGFRGWGCEDHAWLRKVTLLGKVDVSHDPAQRTWHLYHPDSGSHSEQALREAARRNPHYAANARLMARIGTIETGEEFVRQFPPPAHLPAPWPASARLAFVIASARGDTPMAARARDWAERLRRSYGGEVAILSADPTRPDAAAHATTADAIIGMVDDHIGCHALMAAFGQRLTLLVADIAGPPALPMPPHCAPLVAARTASQIGAWQDGGLPTWHRPWDEDDRPGRSGAPAIVAPLSAMMGVSRLWRIRIELDRGALPAPAFDRPRFWYVGLHDSSDQEMARQDLGGAELIRTVAGKSGPIIIERAVTAPRPPATWTIWPTDRQGRWLDKLTGPAQAEDLGHQWG